MTSFRTGCIAVAVTLAIAEPAVAQTCFEPDAPVALTSFQPRRTILADHDGDGDLDLATQMYDVANIAYGYTFHHNDGGGAWQPSGDIAFGTPSFELADVDGDGDADLLDSGTSVGLRLRRSLGASGFGDVEPLMAGNTRQFAAADLDQDGDVDLAVAVPCSVTILRNQGNGTFFASPGPAIDVSRPQAGDFDGDGDRDLVMLAEGAAELRVAFNDGQGAFPGTPITLTAPAGTFHLRVADLNGDGRSDLAIGQIAAGVLSVRISTPGGFAPAVDYPISQSITGLTAGDLDEDGDVDLAAVGTGNMTVFANAGDGTLVAAPAAVVVAGSSAMTLSGGDFDSDGDHDLVFAPTFGSYLYPWRNCAVSGTPACFGDGSATACPCGNASPVGAQAGCLHSLGAGGQLRASGAASISADSITLRGASMPNAPALYFQGTTVPNGGLGAVFGDGLRCASGAIARLGVAMNAGGASQYPTAGQLSVSVRGGVTTAGERHYQVWFRNAASFCAPATFNTTNALMLDWRP